MREALGRCADCPRPTPRTPPRRLAPGVEEQAKAAKKAAKVMKKKASPDIDDAQVSALTVSCHVQARLARPPVAPDWRVGE